jgi:arsenate reductase (thioredoxin)
MQNALMNLLKYMLSIAVFLIAASCAAQKKTTVVFVCEHGAARSVIAAAYFNRLAAERHLPYHAIARGTSAQENLSVATVKGLESDGIPFDRAKPQTLTKADLTDAVRIVSFCPVSKSVSGDLRVDEHDDIPEISQDYGAARNLIVEYVKQVVDDLDHGRL